MSMTDGVKTLGVLVLCAGLAGCEREEIRRYRAVKDSVHEPQAGAAQTPVAPTAPVTAPSSRDQQVLGAITYFGGQTWFFKLAGPAERVTRQADRFHQFVHSLTFSHEAQAPGWTLPEGWTQVDSPSGSIRYATIRPEEDSLELTVTALADRGGGVEANLNRWRNEIGLGPISDPTELRGIAETHEVNGQPVIEINMKGPGKEVGVAGDAPPTVDRPAAAPFARSAGGPPIIGQRLGPVIDKAPTDSPLTYTLPEGWREHAVTPGGMRKAAFSIPGEDQLAEVTIIPLGGPQGLLANVNRWRQEIGLGPMDEAQAQGAATPIEMDGVKGLLFDFEGREFPDGRQFRTLVAMITRDETTWFIKMLGPAQIVEREREDFQALLKSIKFKDGA
jgi:hypothetical protein